MTVKGSLIISSDTVTVSESDFSQSRVTPVHTQRSSSSDQSILLLGFPQKLRTPGTTSAAKETLWSLISKTEKP